MARLLLAVCSLLQVAAAAPNAPVPAESPAAAPAAPGEISAAPTAAPETAPEAAPEAPAPSLAAPMPSAPAPGPGTGGPGRVVVWVKSPGLSDRQARLLEACTVREVGKLQGLEAVSPTTATAGRSGLCPSQDGCLARVAAALGTSRVLTVSAETVKDTDVLTLKLLDLDTATVLEVVSLSTDAEVGALTLVGSAVQRVFGGYARRGDATTGVELAISERWHPRPVNKWVTIGLGAVTLGGAATAMGFGFQALDQQSSFNRLATQAQGSVIDGRTLNQLGNGARDSAAATNVAWAITGALAATSLVVAWFTDWGDDDALAKLGTF